MATFTITTLGDSNLPPYQIGSGEISLSDNNNNYIFNLADFTTNLNPPYADPENDSLSKIKITSLLNQQIGEITLNGVPIALNQQILASDISAGNLVYNPVSQSTQYSEYFEFDVADTGSNSYGNLQGQITLNVPADVNQPPEVGDNSKSLDYGESLIFTPTMFTTGTTPPYSDPEGNPPVALRFTSLPSDNEGEITLNGTSVSIYQEIMWSDIVAGNLVFYPNTQTTTALTIDFNFEIKDSGSGKYGN